jgi:hypothetical protein
MGIKRPGREADHLPPSSAEVKECVELRLHYPNTPSWRGAQLKKHRDKLPLTLPLPFTLHEDVCMKWFPVKEIRRPALCLLVMDSTA